MSQAQAKKVDPNEPTKLKHLRGLAKEVTELKPLLALLEEPEQKEGGPIEQIQNILEAILLGQRHLHLSLEDLHNKLDALSGRRPSTS